MQNISISAFYTKISKFTIRLELHSICIETVSWAWATSIHTQYALTVFWGQRRQRRGIDFGDGGISIQDFCLSPVFVRFCFLLFFIFLLVPLRGESGELTLCTQQLRLRLDECIHTILLLLFLVFSISFCLSFAIPNAMRYVYTLYALKWNGHQ